MLLFENFNETNKICREYGIGNYTISSDGTIDVDGSVYLSLEILTKLPIKFRNVSGDFKCQYNRLTTLEGAPLRVGGDFCCNNNKLTTLKGSPQSVSGDFICYSNNLTTLEGAPKSVSGDFWCFYNELTTLEGVPQSIGGEFNCESNPFDVIRKRFPNSKDFFNANKEWDFFAGGNKIRKLRFKEALADFNIKLPRSIKGYEYI